MEQPRLTIQPVRTPRERREFVAVARAIYPPESPWVRPLDRILLGYLDPHRNPFYRDGVGAAFLAKRGNQPIGRILAHVWRRHHRLHGERAGYFGFFECVDDSEAATGLLQAATSVARGEGCEVLRGPFNMTAAQEMGVTTDGFGEMPAVDMVYTPPWYPSLLQTAGLHPCFRMQTWRNEDIDKLDPDAFLSQRHGDLQAAVGLHVRALSSRRRAADLEHVRGIINAAFLGNWGFVPITRDEWKLQVEPLVPLLEPELVLLAEVQGVPIGVTFAVPDFNQVLRRMNGRLLHPAALALLRRAQYKGAVIILIAVRKQYQGLGIIRRLNAELVRTLQRGGYRSLATTWVSTENNPSRAQVEALQMHRLHDLAMYERGL